MNSRPRLKPLPVQRSGRRVGGSEMVLGDAAGERRRDQGHLPATTAVRVCGRVPEADAAIHRHVTVGPGPERVDEPRPGENVLRPAVPGPATLEGAQRTRSTAHGLLT